MKRLLGSLIQPIHAEDDTDAVAQPTFFTDIDFSSGGNGGNNGGGGNTAGEGSITLLTDDTNFSVGGTFEVDINVDSNDTEIGSYTVKIEYTPQYVSVNDADADVSGTQIEFLTQSFNEVQNEVNTNTGTIILKGEIGTPAAIATTVGKIKFTAAAEGSAEIKVVKAESSMVDDASTNILQNTNGLAITVGETVGQAGEIIDDPLTPTDVTDDVKKLPDSDLPFAGALYMALGIVLILVGIQAKRLAQKRDPH